MPTTSQTKDRIVDAAIRCFKRHGFSASRIADIATEAGAGKGTVYEYFSSKEDLLLASCLRSCRQGEAEIETLLERLRDDASTPPVLLAHETLRTVLTVHLARSRDDQRLFGELSTVASTHPDLAKRMATEFHRKLEQWRELSRTLYERARDSGDFREIEDPDDVARLLVALVDGVIWQSLIAPDRPEEEIAQRITDTAIRMLLAEPERLEEYLA